MNPFDSYSNPFDSYMAKPQVLNNKAMPPNSNASSSTKMKQEQEEEPIFVATGVKFHPPAPICNVMTRNLSLVIALKNGHVIWFNLQDSKDRDDIEIASNREITKLFLDPSSNHLLCGVGDETYYVHKSTKKPKLMKWKGIESVAWERKGTTNDLICNLLVGSHSGHVYEATLDATQTLLGLKSAEKYKQLYSLGTEPVTGLEYQQFPGAEEKYFVMATDSTTVSPSKRIHQFVWGPSFEANFSNLSKTKVLPGLFPRTSLSIYGKKGQPMDYFALLSAPGIFHGSLSFVSGENVIGDDTDILKHPNDDPAVAIALTEFHFFILQETRITAVSRITKEAIWEHTFPEKMLGMTSDVNTGITFAYSARQLYEIETIDEDREVWRQYLSIEKFDLAEQFAKTLANKEHVWSKRADYHFNKAQYDLAAQCYSKANRAFDEITLKFINLNKMDALRVYLKAKLETLSHRDSTQFTLICTWLLEMYLVKLVDLAHSGGDSSAAREDFYQFLEEQQAHLDTKTTFRLISSYGRVEDLLFYADLKKEYEKLIQYHLQHGIWKEALVILQKQQDPRLFYKHGDVLMEKVPVETVNYLIKNFQIYETRLLIPCFLHYERCLNGATSSFTEHQVLRYLKFVVSEKKEQDPVVHNYLLYLYVQGDEGPLLNYLKQKVSYYDLQYALRLCTEHKKQMACVIIYSKMKLYEDAISHALSIGNLDLAKQIAEMPTDEDVRNSEELRKKLWLQIAKRVVEEEKQHLQGMGSQATLATTFLQDCTVLKIEDILPFFPDFEYIDDFKDVICKQLTEYNLSLVALQEEIAEASDNADFLREDIGKVRENYVVIDANQKCEECKYPLLTRPFLIFPCGHGFHHTCANETSLPPSAVSECVLCNSFAVAQLDSPFVDPLKIEDSDWSVPINERKELI